MATTTNFGWETPDDTDLVKDGALALRTLGNAIDSSMADLKGGTTGQVLSKNSNTDMDFVWVTSDDANAIQNAIVDAKGDLITATAADTPARLAVGSNGDTLVADSAATTGLRWSPAPSTGNPVANSAFQIWQRGTTGATYAFGGTSGFVADRWQLGRGGAVAGATISRQLTNDTTNLPFIQYCARVQRDSGNTSTNAAWITQSFESINSIFFAGKTVTLSFYARSGANYSPTSAALGVTLGSGTGTDQNYYITGFTGGTQPISQNVTLTSTWQRFTLSGTVPTNSTQLAIQIGMAPTGTAGANDFFEITGIQLDVGSVALPFRTAGGTLQGETALCQRYYYRTTPGNDGRFFGISYNYNTTNGVMQVNFPVTMRVRPTALEQSGTAADYAIWRANTVAENLTSVPTYDGGTTSQMAVMAGATAGNLTANTMTPFVARNANAYLGWSAEL